MKKTLSLFLAALLAAGALVLPTAAAKPGDPIGWVLYTNIVTYIDDHPIRSYNIDGNTYIVVEDLMEFGFEVTWDGATSKLSVGEKTGPITSTYKPEKNTHNPGDRAMQYLFTNVTTWLKGTQVTGYNIGGYTCVFMDDIAEFYATEYVWDGAASELRMKTGKSSSSSQYTIPTEKPTSGTAGPLSWQLNDKGVLRITGSGDMPDYISRQDMPWDGIRYQIKSLEIGEGVTSICDEAFFSCNALTSVSLPSSLAFIGERSFYFCDSLKSVTIPARVTSIGSGAFSRCTSLTAINVASGNNYYVSTNGVLFNKDKTLLHTYPAGKSGTSFEVPAGVTALGYGAFEWCYNLKTVSLPSGLLSIGAYAFEYCEDLSSLTLPNTVEFIGDGAFGECTSLRSFTLPASVRTIGRYAFKNWTASQTIRIVGRTATPIEWDDDWYANSRAKLSWGN